MKIYLKDLLILFYGLISLGLTTWSLVENFRVTYEEPNPEIANVFGIGGSIHTKIPEVLKNKRINDVQVFFNFPKSSGHTGPIDINNKVFYSLERVDKPSNGKQSDDLTFKIDGIKANRPKELRNGQKKLNEEQFSKLNLITQLHEPKLLYFHTENTNKNDGIEGIYRLIRTKNDNEALSKQGLYLTKRQKLNQAIYKETYKVAKQDIKTTLSPIIGKTQNVSVRVVDLPLEKIRKLSIQQIKASFPSELNKPPVFSLIVKEVELPTILSPEELKIAGKLSLVKPPEPNPDGRSRVVTPGDRIGSPVIGGKPKEEPVVTKKVDDDRDNLLQPQVTDGDEDGGAGLEDRNKENVVKQIPATKILPIAKETKKEPEQDPDAEALAKKKRRDEREDLVIESVGMLGEDDEDDDEEEFAGLEDDRDREKVTNGSTIPATKILPIPEEPAKNLVNEGVDSVDHNPEDEKIIATPKDDEKEGAKLVTEITDPPTDAKGIGENLTEVNDPKGDGDTSLDENKLKGPQVIGGSENHVETVKLPGEAKINNGDGDSDLDGEDPDTKKVTEEQKLLVDEKLTLPEETRNDVLNEVKPLDGKNPVVQNEVVIKGPEEGKVIPEEPAKNLVDEGVDSVTDDLAKKKVTEEQEQLELKTVAVLQPPTKDQIVKPPGSGDDDSKKEEPVVTKKVDDDRDNLLQPQVTDGDEDGGAGLEDRNKENVVKQIPATKILPIAKETKKEPEQDPDAEALAKKKRRDEREDLVIESVRMLGEDDDDDDEEEFAGLEDDRDREKVTEEPILPVNEKLTSPEEPAEGRNDEATGLDEGGRDDEKVTDETKVPEVVTVESSRQPVTDHGAVVNDVDEENPDEALAKKKKREEQEDLVIQSVGMLGEDDEDDDEEEEFTKKVEDGKDGIPVSQVTDHLAEGDTSLNGGKTDEVDPENGKVTGDPKDLERDKVKLPDPPTEDPDDGSEIRLTKNLGDQDLEEMLDFFD